MSCPSGSLQSGTCRMCDQKRESLWEAGQIRLCTCKKTSVSSAIVSITVICSTVAATHKNAAACSGCEVAGVTGYEIQ